MVCDAVVFRLTFLVGSRAKTMVDRGISRKFIIGKSAIITIARDTPTRFACMAKPVIAKPKASIHKYEPKLELPELSSVSAYKAIGKKHSEHSAAKILIFMNSL